jgi:hypothetical protein
MPYKLWDASDSEVFRPVQIRSVVSYVMLWDVASGYSVSEESAASVFIVEVTTFQNTGYQSPVMSTSYSTAS